MPKFAKRIKVRGSTGRSYGFPGLGTHAMCYLTECLARQFSFLSENYEEQGGKLSYGSFTTEKNALFVFSSRHWLQKHNYDDRC